MSSRGPGCELERTPLNCHRSTPAHYLMCGPHWRQVPAGHQAAVYAGLDAGLDSPAYRSAVADAVNAVLERNGLPPLPADQAEPPHLGA